MNLQTFKAPTMAEALTQVKRVMGPDAVILHTRTLTQRYWLGLRRHEIVEITAGRGLQMPDRRRAPVAGAAPSRQPTRVLPSAPNPNNYVAPRDLTQAGRDVLSTPAGNTAVMLTLREEMKELKIAVGKIVSEVRQTQKPQVPDELFEHYMQLIGNQVAEELALEIIKNVQRQIRPEHAEQPEYVREKIADQLEKYMPMAGPIVRTKATGPHVVALIGPTGVGKTTTIAKLAANLKLREKRRVGLITIDTYRIAAIDQLRKYADIIGSPLKVVGNPDDLREAIATMSTDCEFILIDTAGRSPNDTLKLNELKNFLAVASPDEVHLVLSTTSSQACVELAIERFNDVRADKIIFTKLDEAAHVGVMLNVVRKVNKSLSYVTTGQDVPDDIEVGKGRRLAQLILGSNL
ncbi:MAG TPA: flagellar biosynthesis protein FlhF [Tepidisphaeraceae bacterium]|jgi:flagellar biosynthesis protein FlhF|nr:flagellar biosynthesis protein FlhF [Tepidisphaeraceae bacterium]